MAQQYSRSGSTFLLSRATHALNCSLVHELGFRSAASSTSLIGVIRKGAQ